VARHYIVLPLLHCIGDGRRNETSGVQRWETRARRNYERYFHARRRNASADDHINRRALRNRYPLPSQRPRRAHERAS